MSRLDIFLQPSSPVKYFLCVSTGSRRKLFKLKSNIQCPSTRSNSKSSFFQIPKSMPSFCSRRFIIAVVTMTTVMVVMMMIFLLPSIFQSTRAERREHGMQIKGAFHLTFVCRAPVWRGKLASYKWIDKQVLKENATRCPSEISFQNLNLVACLDFHAVA